MARKSWRTNPSEWRWSKSRREDSGGRVQELQAIIPVRFGPVRTRMEGDLRPSPDRTNHPRSKSAKMKKRARSWRDEQDPKKKNSEDKNESWDELKAELEEREKLEARNKRRMDREVGPVSTWIRFFSLRLACVSLL